MKDEGICQGFVIKGDSLSRKHFGMLGIWAAAPPLLLSAVPADSA